MRARILQPLDSSRMSEKNPEELRRLLVELHEALAAAESVGPGIELPLRAVLADIQRALDTDEGGESASEQQSLEQRAEVLALEFEVAHPTIAGTLNRVTHLLSSTGI